MTQSNKNDHSDERWMEEAASLALKNIDKGGGPFGAVIVKDGKVIGRGANRVTQNLDPTAHAEVMAIREACGAIESFQLSGATLYTSCEPCPMCLAAAYWSRVDRIVFGCTQDDAAAIGFDDAFLYRELRLPHQERSIPIEGLGREYALRAFQRWDSTEDKVPY
jgi:tRNA(Arg) A34 adenosine deaminase TadA